MAARKVLLEVLSDYFLVVQCSEAYSSQVHYKCGMPLEQYRRYEVRTETCYHCSQNRRDGKPELVNRDFNAAINILEWLCFHLQGDDQNSKKSLTFGSVPWHFERNVRFAARCLC